MRDRHFVAVHRGGLLEPEQHRLLAVWAADCAEHVLPLFSQQHPDDNRLQKAIEVARAWALGQATVGEARAASVAAHAAAREAQGAAQWVARAAGHAVATAHMADHSLGAALYGAKAVRAVHGEEAANLEQIWQQQQIPVEIRDLVLSAASIPKFRNLWPI